MGIGLDTATLLTGLLVFAARMSDVALGTIRMIATVQGRLIVSFVLGFFEVNLWLVVITAVVVMVQENPILAVFYGLGFSSGNVLGIYLERRIALGHVIIRMLTPTARGYTIAARLRAQGFGVTVFKGEGLKGPVEELVVVCPRKRMKKALDTARGIEPDIFFVTEMPGQVRRLHNADAIAGGAKGGWQTILKRK